MVLGNCKACGAMATPDASFCIKCGASLDDPWKCPSCGSKNISEAAFCATCGTRLGSGMPRDISQIWAEPGSSRPATVETRCSRCGSPVLTTDWMCPTCGKDLHTTELIVAREDSPVPAVIGVLLIVAGVLNIVNGLLMGSASSILPAFGFCGVLEVVAGVVTIPGGFAAIGKKHFVPVFIVSIITLFSVGPCFISSIFGLIAVIGLLVARNEFES